MSSFVYLSRHPLGPSLLIAALCTIFLTSGGIKPAQASMCQYHQAYLESQANINQNQNSNNLSPYLQQLQQQLTAAPVATNGQQHQNLIVCPKSSQYNNLPVQFASINTKLSASPTFERHQRDLLKSLNASFTNYLQLNSHQQSPSQLAPEQALAASSDNNQILQQAQQPGERPSTATTTTTTGNQQNQFVASDLIDDELLNEIISPLIVDEAYVRAKELIVKRRKLENELVKQGFVTDMKVPSAVARHQRVTTTTTRGNELEKSQEVFDEMSRILSQKIRRDDWHCIALRNSSLGGGQFEAKYQLALALFLVLPVISVHLLLGDANCSSTLAATDCRRIASLPKTQRL